MPKKKNTLLTKAEAIEKLMGMKPLKDAFSTKTNLGNAIAGVTYGWERLLVDGEGFRLGEIGTLTLKDVPEVTRERRNPKTGEKKMVTTPAHRKVVFKPFTMFKKLSVK